MLQAGAEFGHTYRLEKLLGKGGMGEVWLAEHLLLNEPRAIKVMLGRLATNPVERERFIQREARNALRLARHPNIVRIYELSQYEDTPYIVMEYVEGGVDGNNLKDLVINKTRISPEECGAILWQLSQALNYAHEMGLVHRDIKPANILLDKGDIVKVTDFGLTKDLQDDIELTGSGYSMGTPIYMAPEQARGEATAASDQYAVGVVLYEMLTGRLPFWGDAVELLIQHATQIPIPLEEYVPGLPSGVSQVVLRMLAKRPQDRFTNLLDAAQSFQNALTDTQGSRNMPTTAISTASPYDATTALPMKLAGAKVGSVQNRANTATVVPSGVVTSFLSDIKASAELREQYPDVMPAVLEQHDALLQDIIRQEDGYIVFKRANAGFYAIFASATQAAKAAVAIQQAVFNTNWGTLEKLPVRIALDTGQAEEQDNTKTNLMLNRINALLAAAQGGQILMSASTRDAIGGDLPPGSELRDEGQHRLKHSNQPEQLFQLLVPNLGLEAMPLNTLDAIPNNLPQQLTSFIGREAEITELVEMLMPGGTTSSRLVTLLGAGGSGKTRLSLEVATELLEHFRDGAWFVELAPVFDSATVLQTVATVLGVREEPNRPLQATLTHFLRQKQLLLVVDNCEQVVEAVAQLTEVLLRVCPKLKVLATSRIPLGIAGENPWRVPSLKLPDPEKLPALDQLMQYEAVKLFVERAQIAQPKFYLNDQNAAAVAQVCKRLDGIPLALELAAARVKVLAVNQISNRLNEAFRLLTGGNEDVPRHQTLRATIDWSYELLDEPEKQVLQRLSVFAGGWVLEAAETVCAGEVVDEYEVLDWLSRLVDKSLVTVETLGEESRYRLLETIRQYAGEKLQKNEADNVLPTRQKHLAWFTQLAEQAEPELQGKQQLDWLKRLETEHDNIRTALELSKTDATSIESAIRLAAALRQFWQVRGYLREGQSWLEFLLTADMTPVSLPAQARLLNSAGFIDSLMGNYQRVVELQEQALVLHRQLNDKVGLAFTLFLLGSQMSAQGNFEQAKSYLTEGLELARASGNKWYIALILASLGTLAGRLADYQQLKALMDESLTLRRQIGDKQGIAVSLNNLAGAAWAGGDFAQASALLQESLTISRELGDRRATSRGLVNLASLAREQANFAKAIALHQENLNLTQDLGDQQGYLLSCWNLGLLNFLQKDYSTAQKLLSESITISREIGDKASIALCLEYLGWVAAAKGETERAVRLQAAAEAIRQSIGTKFSPKDRDLHEQTKNALLAQLGQTLFDEFWIAGQNMSIEGAVAYALHD